MKETGCVNQEVHWRKWMMRLDSGIRGQRQQWFRRCGRPTTSLSMWDTEGRAAGSRSKDNGVSPVSRSDRETILMCLVRTRGTSALVRAKSNDTSWSKGWERAGLRGSNDPRNRLTAHIRITSFGNSRSTPTFYIALWTQLRPLRSVIDDPIVQLGACIFLDSFDSIGVLRWYSEEK